MSIRDFRPTVVITSGGTTEMIDNVRCMSNISTGQTGATIAEMFLANGWEVIYIYGIGASIPNTEVMYTTSRVGQLKLHKVKSAMDAHAEIMSHVKYADAVIHAMAVSDFTFDLSDDVKLDSSDAYGFIEYLKKTIRPNVKILPMIKSANPNAYVMGFKYTVGKTQEEQIAIAKAQNLTNSIDATFVNDDVMMRENGSRCGILVTKNNGESSLTMSREDSAQVIYGEVTSNMLHYALNDIRFKFLDIKNPFKI
jgi:phosphopantothenate---cysteine ligase (CTP)